MRSVAWLSLGVATWAAAQDVPSHSAKLPAVVAEVFSRAQVPLDHVALVVKEAGAKEVLIAHNVTKPMNPASVIKLITTYAGLELLGPAHTWKTEFYLSGELHGRTLTGDLVIRGGGDPKLTGDKFAQALRMLRERGLTHLKGDLVLDKTLFEPQIHDPAAFDGEPLKAYNVGADALLLHFKAPRFAFAPSLDGRSVAIAVEPRLSQLDIVNRMKLTEGPCGEWRNRVIHDVQMPHATQLKVSFSGHYPKDCGEQGWSLALLDHARFVGGAFAKSWAELGGSWSGVVRIGATPADARLVASIESAPMAETVRDINKFSNNVMARQLFLALSADGIEAASTTRSAQRIKEWLDKKGVSTAGLVIENGSGLSRVERASAQTLAGVLDAAWTSAVMPEFISSMPLLGVDGTFRRRARGEGVAGQAHVKGGTLNEVRAIAGFVLDPSGKRWIVVLLSNHANAALAQSAQDVLLKWLATGQGSAP